jgi:hypothetical protein
MSSWLRLGFFDWTSIKARQEAIQACYVVSESGCFATAAKNCLMAFTLAGTVVAAIAAS